MTYDREIKEYTRAHAIETIEPELFISELRLLLRQQYRVIKLILQLKTDTRRRS